MVDRIRYTSILGNGLIVEINLAVSINGYVLKQRISLDCVVDVGLGILVQVDNLSVASTFEVEYAVVIPTVLVITDQQTLRIGRQSGLTGSGQTEEDSGVLTVHIGVCGAVHGSDTLQRQEVVHHGEHTLLHFSAVPCIHNNLLTAGNIESYTSLGIQPQLLVILNLSLGCVVNYEIRLEVLQLFLGGFDKHVGYEMSLPSYLNDKTDSHAGVLVSAAECIYNEQSLVGQLLLSDILYSSPCFLRHTMVVVLVLIGSPPYSVLGVLIFNDELIFGRTSCIYTGHNVYRTEFGLLTFLVAFQFRLHLFFE